MSVRPIKALLVMAFVFPLTAGCGDGEPETVIDQPVSNVEIPFGDLSVHVIEVNGRKVSCVVYESTSKGGLSCDFTREATR